MTARCGMYAGSATSCDVNNIDVRNVLRHRVAYFTCVKTTRNKQENEKRVPCVLCYVCNDIHFPMYRCKTCIRRDPDAYHGRMAPNVRSVTYVVLN